MESGLAQTWLADLSRTVKEIVREPNAADSELLEEFRTNSGWLESPHHAAIGGDPFAHEIEDIGHADDVFFQSRNLGDVNALPGAITQARQLHDNRDRGSNLLPYRFFRNIDAGHRYHRLEAHQCVPRCVGMDRRHRAFVAGIHRLQ